MGRKKGGGGKLSRSEILQARLNPKLRVAAEIMARIQRRTVSSLIEILVEDAMKHQKISEFRMVRSPRIPADTFKKIEEISLNDAIDYIWSPEEADRFANFAFHLPVLMSPKEASVWHWVNVHTYFWSHFEVRMVTKSGKLLPKTSLTPLRNSQGFLYERFRKHWPLIKSILEDKTSIEKLENFDAPKEKIIKIDHKLPDGINIVDIRYD